MIHNPFSHGTAWERNQCLIFFLLTTLLKVHKCDIFDSFDFHNFYTIKPFWVGDFGADILIKFLIHTLGICLCSLSNLCICCAVHAWVPYSYTQCWYKLLMRALSIRIYSKFLRRMLSIHIKVRADAYVHEYFKKFYMFGTWLGQDQDYLRKSPEVVFRSPPLLKGPL
jgi:hypothetical protein